jgi:hypothetical protein
MTDVRDNSRSPRPVRYTAGLRGFVMQADNVCSADDGMRRTGAKLAKPYNNDVDKESTSSLAATDDGALDIDDVYL